MCNYICDSSMSGSSLNLLQYMSIAMMYACRLNFDQKCVPFGFGVWSSCTCRGSFNLIILMVFISKLVGNILFT